MIFNADELGNFAAKSKPEQQKSLIKGARWVGRTRNFARRVGDHVGYAASWLQDEFCQSNRKKVIENA